MKTLWNTTERMDRCRRGTAHEHASEIRARCRKPAGPDAGLNFSEGRACLHLEDLFLGRVFYLR